MTNVIRIKGGTDNCYLVTDGENAILVDTATKEHLDRVIAECDKYRMKLIVLTHVHFDHAENAAELSKRYDIPVEIHHSWCFPEGFKTDESGTSKESYLR